MVQRVLYAEELITCKGGKESHIIVKKNGKATSLLTRTSYIICGVPFTVKMWNLLFKSYEDLLERNINPTAVLLLVRLYAAALRYKRCEGLSQWEEWDTPSQKVSSWEKLRLFYIKDVFSLLNPNHTNLSLPSHVLILCIGFFFFFHFKSSHLTYPHSTPGD